MDTDSYSRDAASQTDDAGLPLPYLPYPLTRGTALLWLRRGDGLGRAACRIAATVAAGCERAAKWRRHVASKGPIDTPPPQPG